MAYTFGPRNDATCRDLLALLTPFNIGMITSDDWGSYAREVPKEKHLTGKTGAYQATSSQDNLLLSVHRSPRKGHRLLH
ncbi:TPA: IS1 family transposase [Serratia fonticola]